jgi:hypothetical protein
MLWGWDVLELGPFVLGRSVVGRFVLGCFVRAPQEGTLNVEKEQRNWMMPMSCINILFQNVLSPGTICPQNVLSPRMPCLQ